MLAGRLPRARAREKGRNRPPPAPSRLPHHMGCWTPRRLAKSAPASFRRQVPGRLGASAVVGIWDVCSVLWIFLEQVVCGREECWRQRVCLFKNTAMWKQSYGS